MRLGFVKSSLEGGGDLRDVVEAEACSNLTGMLRQLADLVDHTATVIEGLEAQVCLSAGPCKSLAWFCFCLARRCVTMIKIDSHQALVLCSPSLFANL